MIKITLYDVLQVSRDAEPETIKAAYKSLVQRYHPDKNPDNAEAERIVKKINHAYEVLSDPIKRAEYDAALEAEERVGAGFSRGTMNAQRNAEKEKDDHSPRNAADKGAYPKNDASVNKNSTQAKQRDYIDLMDGLPALALAHMGKSLVSIYFHGSPIEFEFVGVAMLVGGSIGYVLARYIREKVTENISMWDSRAKVLWSASISIGLTLAILSITALITTSDAKAKHRLHASPEQQAQTTAASPAAQGTDLQQTIALAERGDAKAQSNLGYMYDKGDGVPQNYAQAARWYRKAADQGDAGAQSNLGTMYFDGHGVPQDYAQAMMWLRKAADQGDAGAQSNLGTMYDNGHGVQQDYAQAARWYRKAADQGLALAQSNLGTMYFDGHGVPQDYAQAMMWLRKAADQGDAGAQFNMGAMYFNGHGVPQNYVNAMMWYRKAADQGYAGWWAAHPRK